MKRLQGAAFCRVYCAPSEQVIRCVANFDMADTTYLSKLQQAVPPEFCYSLSATPKYQCHDPWSQ